MNSDPFDPQKAVQAAVAALRRGDKIEAQRLAQIATMGAPDSETPWLILAALSSPAESLGYIQQALQINPNSKPALQAKRWALDKLHAQAPVPPAFQAPVPPAFQPQEPPAFQTEGSSAFQTTEPPAEEPFSEREAFLDRIEKQNEQPEPTDASVPEGLGEEEQFSQVSGSINGLRPAEVEPVYTQTDEEVKQGKIPTYKQARPFWVVLIILAAVSLAALVIIIRPLLSGQLAGTLSENRCIASLMIGSQSYEVRTVVPKSDGSFLPPSNRQNTIYWVEGTDINLVFALGTTADNLVLAPAITVGNIITLVWPNCDTARFTITELKPDQPFKLSMVDQTLTRLSIFIPAVRANKGYLVSGELMDQTIYTPAVQQTAAP